MPDFFCIFTSHYSQMVDILSTKIEYLKGIGPKRAELLNKELGIFTFGDMLEYYPFRYIDKAGYTKSVKYATTRSITNSSVQYQIYSRSEVRGQPA